MATETKTKVPPMLDVGYSDKSGTVTVTDPAQDDAEVESVNVRELAPNAPEMLILAFVRYLAGNFRDIVSAYQKAKKTVAEAGEAIAKAAKAARDGTLQFRERGGEGSLTDEQAQEIVAGVIVKLGIKGADGQPLTAETAKAWVLERYNVTKEITIPAKGTPGADDYRAEKKAVTRPAWVKVKRVPAVKEALEAAVSVDSASQLQSL